MELPGDTACRKWASYLILIPKQAVMELVYNRGPEVPNVRA